MVEGFAGVFVRDERFHLNPYIPEAWKAYSFKITFRGRKLKISVDKEKVTVEQSLGEPLPITIHGRNYLSKTGTVLSAPIPL